MNVRYARRCVRDSLMLGEAPIASHLLYTQPGILRDHLMSERARGIEAGLVWSHMADLVVFYLDRGMSKGMELGLEHHRKIGSRVEFRMLAPRRLASWLW
jgi:hypothetical protein